MSIRIVFRHSLQAGIACALALTFTAACAAQSSTAPTWIGILSTKVKPEMQQEYEGYMKTISAAYKKDGAPYRAVYQNVFGNTSEFTSVTQLDKFASMDGPSLLERVLGAEGWAKLRGNLYHCTLETHRTAAMARDDLSIHNPMTQPYPFAIVNSTRIAASKRADYENWLKNDYVPALKKAGVQQYWVSRTIFGGNTNELVAVTLLKKLGDIDDGPMLNKSMDAAARAKLFAKIDGINRSSENIVVRLRPELSYFPAPPASGK